MGRLNQAAKTKRDRERARQEFKQEKLGKRAQRTEEAKTQRDRFAETGIDPDIAGIVPGPQPEQNQ
jgi:hypothetical protein